MNASQTMAGRQFIAGRRVASGEATLLSLRAVDGEATGHRFIRLHARRPLSAAEAAAAGVCRLFTNHAAAAGALSQRHCR